MKVKMFYSLSLRERVGVRELREKPLILTFSQRAKGLKAKILCSLLLFSVMIPVPIGQAFMVGY